MAPGAAGRGIRPLPDGRRLGESKEARRSKTVSRLEDGDRRLVHRQYNLGPGGEERLFMELVLTRARASARGD